MKQPLFVILVCTTATLYVGCGETVDTTAMRGQTQYLGQLPTRTGVANQRNDTVSHWDGDGIVGAPSIRIDLSEQEARFYKGGELVGRSMISTGREGYNTPTGTFSIIQKNADHRSNLYGEWVDGSGNVIDNDVDVRLKPTPPPGYQFLGASMPHFMRITGGVGMHAGFLPGFPDSHGCIRMPAHMAARFYAESAHGTPVTVTR